MVSDRIARLRLAIDELSDADRDIVLEAVRESIDDDAHRRTLEAAKLALYPPVTILCSNPKCRSKVAETIGSVIRFQDENKRNERTFKIDGRIEITIDMAWYEVSQAQGSFHQSPVPAFCRRCWTFHDLADVLRAVETARRLNVTRRRLAAPARRF